jgi:hypothetical protein
MIKVKDLIGIDDLLQQERIGGKPPSSTGE